MDEAALSVLAPPPLLRVPTHHSQIVLPISITLKVVLLKFSMFLVLSSTAAPFSAALPLLLHMAAVLSTSTIAVNTVPLEAAELCPVQVEITVMEVEFNSIARMTNRYLHPLSTPN